MDVFVVLTYNGVIAVYENLEDAWKRVEQETEEGKVFSPTLPFHAWVQMTKFISKPK